jgi:hypothetical protein
VYETLKISKKLLSFKNAANFTEISCTTLYPLKNEAKLKTCHLQSIIFID